MSFKKFSAWLLTGLAATLVGCGGGGGASGTPLTGRAGDPPVADLTVTMPSTTISNSVSSTLLVTVTAVDANRVTLADVPVTLSVDSDATLTASAAKTNSAGQVTGTVRIGSNTTPRRITVTAKAGALTRTALIDVVATTAADLALTLTPSARLSNSGATTVVVTVTAVDINRATVSGIPIALKVDNNATINTSGPVTDANGQVIGTVSIGGDKTNRIVTVTATSGALVKTVSIQVEGAKITATVLGAVLVPGDVGRIQYRVVDDTGNPIADQPITITGLGGVQTAARSGSSGEYEYRFIAPNTAGVLEIRASIAGFERTDSVIVNSGAVTIPVVTAQVLSASVSANPSVVVVNTANSTVNRSEIRALFLSSGNTPVKNIRVRFDLDGDVQSIGGTFTSGSTLVYSDVNGVATSAYVPAGRFSPTDGVTVRACWDKVDFSAPACPNSAKATLTVVEDPLSVTIGTSNAISVGASNLSYVIRYLVQVVDSSGLAANDVQVSAQIDLLRYLKGEWLTGTEAWEKFVRATCDNEDMNRNGVAEDFGNGVVEDANQSAGLVAGRPALEPRKADVAISFEGSNKTNSSGQVILRIEYPQNVGSWVAFNIVVSASGVAGTEGRANFDGTLAVPAAVVNNIKADPPFRYSPYGIGASAVVAAMVPGSGKISVLCTNPN